MKNLLMSLVALLMLGLTSCATFKKQDSYLPLVSPAVQLAATGVLDAAKTPADRDVWAAAMRRAAQVVRLIPDTKPEPALVRQKILEAAPFENALWTKLATTVSEYYARAVARVPNDLSAITAVLVEVASGLERAAAVPAPVVEPEPPLPTSDL